MCSHQSASARALFEPPYFLEVLRRSLRKFLLLGKLAWNTLCCVYSRRALCVTTKFALAVIAALKVAVTHRQVTQYDVTFARGAQLHASSSSLSIVCMSVVPNTSTLEYVTWGGGPAWHTEHRHAMNANT